MSDDSGSASGVGELVGEERAEETGVLARGAQFYIAAGMVGMKAGVQDELNRLGAELADRCDDFVGQLAGAGIDNEGALIAYLHGDVAAVTDQHIDVALHGQDVDFTIVRVGIDGAAGLRGTGRT